MVDWVRICLEEEAATAGKVRAKVEVGAAEWATAVAAAKAVAAGWATAAADWGSADAG